MTKPKAFITGIAGFIGSHLADHLLEEGWEVRGCDDLRAGEPANVPTVDWYVKGAEHLSPEYLAEADVIFHLAASVSVPESFLEPGATMVNNVAVTAAVCDVALKARVPTVVYASSSAVYGDLGEHEAVETDLCNPMSPYGSSKLAAEVVAREFAQRGLRTVGLRFFNVYGPRQRSGSSYAGVISRWTKALMSSKSPTVFGSPDKTRDFTYVKDVTEACRLAALRGRPGEVYNIGTGYSWTLRQLYDALCETIGRAPAPEVLPPRLGDIVHSQADIRKARLELGYESFWSLRDGIKETVRCFH